MESYLLKTKNCGSTFIDDKRNLHKDTSFYNCISDFFDSIDNCKSSSYTCKEIVIQQLIEQWIIKDNSNKGIESMTEPMIRSLAWSMTRSLIGLMDDEMLYSMVDFACIAIISNFFCLRIEVFEKNLDDKIDRILVFGSEYTDCTIYGKKYSNCVKLELDLDEYYFSLITTVNHVMNSQYIDRFVFMNNQDIMHDDSILKNNFGFDEKIIKYHRYLIEGRKKT